MAAAWKHRRRFDWYHPEKASPIDTESLRAWGERTVGRDAVDWLLSPATSTLFFWNAEETSWWLAAAMAWTAATGGWRTLVPQGGMGAVPRALSSTLRVRLRTAVQRVEPGDGGPILVRTADPAGQATLEADRVILATPAPVALALLPDPEAALGPEEAAFLRSIRYVSNLTTAVAYASRPEERAYGVSVPLAVGSKLAAIGWEHLKEPGRVPAGSGLAILMPTHSYSLARGDGNDEEVGAELIAAADGLYPGSRAHALWHRTQRWEHAMPVLQPGWSRALANVLSVQSEKGRKVFTCGDYWLGPTTESALVSGVRAAAAVLRSLGRAGDRMEEMDLL